METGISDIQIIDKDKVEITFCSYPNCEDFMTITIDTKTAWEISNFCKMKLKMEQKIIKIK